MHIKNIIIIFTLLLANTVAKQSIAQQVNISNQASLVNWISMEDASKLIKEKPKKILIEVYTDWCKWCKRLDAEVLSDSSMAAYINEQFYAVRFNAESKTPVVFDGETFNYNPIAKINELALVLLENEIGYPAIIILDETFALLQPIRGFVPLAEFAPIVKFYGTNQYKTESWETYKNKSGK